MNEKQKIEIGNSLYIMLSTLNQMVNYIPLKYFGFKNILNLTIDDDKNKTWDKCLKKVLNQSNINIDPVLFEHRELLDIEYLKEKLSEHNTIEQASSIFWNITGGQRPFVLAVYDLIKEKLKDKTHYICYLEGNSKKMQLMKFEQGKQVFKNFDGNNLDYELNEHDLNLQIALQLMGYNIKGIKQQNLKQNEQKDLIKLYQLYINNLNLRKTLVDSNKKDNSDLDAVKKQLSSDLSYLVDQHKDKSYPFGYLLEDMVFAVLKQHSLHKIAAIAHSVKLQFNDDILNTEIGNKQLDEFDILVLSKQGQIINFECKSGGMSGDVAKSTNYSTYAIAGVYGLPILITPLTCQEREDLNVLDKDIYRYVIAAVKSAKRANLEVWGIDEIKTKLKDHLNI